MTAFLDREIHLKDYLYILRKRRGAIFIFFIFILSLGVIHTLREKVLFSASATVMIERQNPNVVDFKQVVSFDASETEYYQTQFQMIKSRSLIRTLFEKEKLAEDSHVQWMLKGKLRHKIAAMSFMPQWIRDYLVEYYPEDVFIKKMLKVKPIRGSRLVQVSVIHPDSNRAADISNKLVDLFIERSLSDRFSISNQATSLISEQLGELKLKVAEAQKKLQVYKEKNQLVNIPSMHEKDSFMQDAKLELVKIQSEESKLANRYLPAHPKMINIHAQIEGLKQKIKDEEQRILSLSNVAIDYAELEREAESSRQIYEALLKRLQETTSEAQTQASNIMIVDRALPPERPFSPQPFLNILIAIFMGMGGGILVAFFLEYFDSTIKVPDDVELGLGLDLLGIIPQAEKNTKMPLKGELIFSPEKPTPASEALRALRTATIFKLRKISGGRVILATSPNPEEGKSTLMINLAKTFVQNHLKVVLVDADLRRPRLHKVFETNPERGLTDVLEGNLRLDEVIHRNVCDLGFDFISCGTSSHHATELLSSDQMKNLINQLRGEYDYVLIDCPPFLAVVDVIVVSEHVDGVLIVTRYQKTDKRHLKNLKKRFSTPEKLLGVVINRVSVREKDHYYHQYYYYGYGEKPRR